MKKRLLLMFSLIVVMMFSLVSGCASSETGSQSAKEPESLNNLNNTETDNPTISPTVEEERKNFSAEKMNKRMETFISDDIDNGADIRMFKESGYVYCRPLSEKKTFIKGKSLEDVGSLQIYPDFCMRQGDKFFSLEIHFQGQLIKDNDVTKVNVYNGSKKIEINSGKISCFSAAWGQAFVEILGVDIPNDTQNLKKLTDYRDLINANQDISVKIFFKNSKSKNYKLNSYQIETFRKTLKYFEEAMTYVE